MKKVYRSSQSKQAQPKHKARKPGAPTAAAELVQEANSRWALEGVEPELFDLKVVEKDLNEQSHEFLLRALASIEYEHNSERKRRARRLAFSLFWLLRDWDWGAYSVAPPINSGHWKEIGKQAFADLPVRLVEIDALEADIEAWSFQSLALVTAAAVRSKQWGLATKLVRGLERFVGNRERQLSGGVEPRERDG